MDVIEFNVIHGGKYFSGKGELIQANFDMHGGFGSERELLFTAKLIPKDDIYLTVYADYDKIIAENKQLREVNKQLQSILNEEKAIS